MIILPPRPRVAAPVPISIKPELPLLDVPELNTIFPLAPLTPPSKLVTTTAPLVDVVPFPLVM
jgi:hypothetical protein